MNLKLIQEHVVAQLATVPKHELKADGSNAQAFFIADVVGNRRFAQNFGGYPRSEIAEINNAASLEQQKLLLAQLNDYRSAADSQNAGLADREIMLSHKSKYMQTASELQDYLCNQIAIRDAKRAEAVRLAAAEQVKKDAKRQADIQAAAAAALKASMKVAKEPNEE